MIAGFDEPDAGEILVDGRSMAGVPPYERDVNTVFQDYALFPHMTVAENIAYGLMVGGVDKATRRARALEALAPVKLEGSSSVARRNSPAVSASAWRWRGRW
ncbi:MAG: ATP-binding cassette domain-containing protein [Gammaproteobacteria bacterium]|nr:ATP-binding cassette domain-containing protein [Gammaproteobacteria bacterium]